VRFTKANRAKVRDKQKKLDEIRYLVRERILKARWRHTCYPGGQAESTAQLHQLLTKRETNVQ